MKPDNRTGGPWLYALGLIPVIWFALLIAPSVSGGLAAKNGGIIESSYNSGKVNAKSDNATGSVAGINGCDEYKPSVSNVFYLNEKGLKAVGSDSTITPDESNIGIPNNADFKDSSFVDKLNSVTDDSVTWLQNNLLNKGYPTIKCSFLNLKVKSAGNNITVKGNMHRDLNIKYDVCKESDSVYKFLSSSCGDNKILKAYSLTLAPLISFKKRLGVVLAFFR